MQNHPYITIQETGALTIKTPYKNTEFTEEIKKLGGYWKREEKVWYSNVKHLQEINALLEQYFPVEGQEDKKEEPVRKSQEQTTLLELIDRCTADKSILFEGDTIARAIAVAYYVGRERATKEVSDAYRKKIREMHQKAQKSRYSALINDVIGDKDYLLFPDYTGRVTQELGCLKTDIKER